MLRSHALGWIAWACAALACASSAPTPAPVPPDVLQGYRWFAKRDCVALRARAPALDSPNTRVEREAFRLLEGYCLELEENPDAARERYRSVLSAFPRHMLGYEAAHRLLALERAPRTARLREELKQQEGESKLQPSDPIPLARVDPVYPVVLREAGIEGWVLANFAISADGSTDDVVILESEPPFVFDAAVLAAIRNWIYTAAIPAQARRRSVRWEFEIAPSDRPAR